MPKELMLILSLRSSGKGVGAIGTLSFFSVNGTKSESVFLFFLTLFSLHHVYFKVFSLLKQKLKTYSLGLGY